MVTVRDEVAKLIADMKAAAIGNPAKEAETIEIAALAMAQTVPDISPDTPAQLITAYARSAVMRAWVQYDMKLRARSIAA